MILLFKFLLALGSFCFLLGFAARRREPPMHPRLMLGGLLLLCGALAVMGGSRLMGLEFPPALYLRRWLGEEPAQVVATVFIGLGGLAVFGCLFQMFTGIIRHPWHRLFPRFLLPLLVFFFIGGIFGFY